MDNNWNHKPFIHCKKGWIKCNERYSTDSSELNLNLSKVNPNPRFVQFININPSLGLSTTPIRLKHDLELSVLLLS